MEDKTMLFGLLCITSFFTIMNPLGIMPVFMTMTASFSEQQKKKTAKKAVIVAFFILISFALAGQLLFKFFNISVDSLKIVGGIIFFFMGHDMLQAKMTKTKLDEKDMKSFVTDISISPLAIPVLCGPGAITNVMVLWQDASNLTEMAFLLGSIVLICVSVYVVFLSSSKLSKIIGETGNKVLMRLMGLILMLMAVEFFFGGLKPILRDILNIA